MQWTQHCDIVMLMQLHNKYNLPNTSGSYLSDLIRNVDSKVSPYFTFVTGKIKPTHKFDNLS